MALQESDGSLLEHLDDLKDAFAAGVNRGCYIASLLRGKAIDGNYPTFLEYVNKKYSLNLSKEEFSLEALPADENAVIKLINKEGK